MKPLHKFWLGLFAAWCGVLAAADDYAILVYPCPRAETPPVIDGRLDLNEWSAAPVVSGFTFYNRPQKTEVQTSVQVLYDAQNLYFGIHCDEPLASKIAAAAGSRDNHSAVFRSESIEVFIDPRHDHTHYYQLAASLSGTLYDSRGSDTTWDSRAVVRTKLGKDSWTAELIIPWSDIDIRQAGPGLVLGFNVCRNRFAGGAKQWTNWSQTKANFHDPQRFGHLVLSATPEQIGGLASEFRKGNRQGPIRVFGKEGVSRGSYLVMAHKALAELESALKELGGAASRESPAAAAELDRRLTDIYKQVEDFKNRLGAAEALNALEFARMELALNRATASLSRIIWDARLAALLNGI